MFNFITITLEGLFSGAECFNSADWTVVYVSAGDSVVLTCDLPATATTLHWANTANPQKIIVGHNIGSNPVHPSNPPYSPAKYVYDTGSHSLTISGFQQSDIECIVCRQAVPSLSVIHSYLVTLTGTYI